MKALITGASSGIGKEFALELAKTFNEIIIVSRREEELNKVKVMIEENSNCKVKVVPLDISVAENCVQLHEENPEVDLLINNAGFGDCGDFAETSLEKDLKMIDTNVIAYHVLTKLYLKSMKEKNHGQIINVASIAGFMPGPLMATYYATKSYVVRLSESIREELRREKSKVKISILCPGPVNTNFNNVANVKFALKGMDSNKVAKYALKHKNRFYIVPGIRIKFSRVLAHVLPSLQVAKITYQIQKRKIEK